MVALLFQSNPDQWDLRGNFQPGRRVSWFVTRYFEYMQSGMLVLLWEAKGSKDPLIRGLYGWGITLSDATPDSIGHLRISLKYIERWISVRDTIAKNPDTEHIAGVTAEEVLSLPSWREHLLAKNPVGTNFLVDSTQIEELRNLVQKKYPETLLGQAIEEKQKGMPLIPSQYKGQIINEVHDG